MSDRGIPAASALALSLVISILAIFAYNLLVVRPQIIALDARIATLDPQATALTKADAEQNTALDKHAEMLAQLGQGVQDNALATQENANATQSLQGAVNYNANVANENNHVIGY